MLKIVDVEAIRRRRFSVVLDACHGAGGRLGAALLRALGCEAVVLGGVPDGRYDHPPEPTEANLRAFAAIVPATGAAVGFAQDPDADRLAIVDETGRYIGEELTLALAASQPAGAGDGAGRDQPLDLARDRGAGRAARAARSTGRRSARSTSSSGCGPRRRSWAARGTAG